MRPRLLLLVAGLVCLCGCGARVKALQSSKARVVPGESAQSHVKDVVAGNTAFALDLYRKLPAEGNVVFSPYSISIALAMTYAGARGETEEQMAQALHFTLPQDQLHASFNALERQIAEIGESGPELRVANSLWLQSGFSVRPEFLDRLAENYGTGVKTVDFAKNGPRAVKAVNAWAEDQTGGHIKDLLPNHLSPQTALVLANGVYLKAEWEEKFSEHGTEPGPFTLLDGKKTQVDMMPGTRTLSKSAYYAQGANYQALELFYTGDRLSMVFLLPAPGKFQEFERTLSPSLLAELWRDLPSSLDRYPMVVVKLPKFTFDSGTSLKEALSALGMGDAFAERANFGGMSSATPLMIEDVWHKGFIAVHEKGTEAAAATAVAVGCAAASAGPDQIPEFIADRPFLFLLRDRKTNAVLFLGRVVDPRR